MNFLVAINNAYNAAATQGNKLADIIALRPYYKYLHLIAHSAGSKLIHTVNTDLFNKSITISYAKPFIHMTFLDAFTPFNDWAVYGISANYAEHYVDRTTLGLGSTDDYLSNAYNVDITAWPMKDLSGPLPGHQWPLIWYTNGIEVPGFGGIYGYPLSLEGGEVAGDVSTLSTSFLPGQSCALSDPTAKCGTQ